MSKSHAEYIHIHATDNTTYTQNVGVLIYHTFDLNFGPATFFLSPAHHSDEKDLSRT
jgi:hypothetical protein